MTDTERPPVNLRRVEHISIVAGDETKTYVAVDDYAKVADERDDLRRQLALINAWRLHHAAAIDPLAAVTLHNLLAAVGETEAIGQAVRDIARALDVTTPAWA